LQEQAHDAKQQAVSPEDTEDLSPLPSAVQQPARRRGGISAEPVSEEDATSYVKKVYTYIDVQYRYALFASLVAAQNILHHLNVHMSDSLLKSELI
jgi:cAMP-dependent protein kinase regulator